MNNSKALSTAAAVTTAAAWVGLYCWLNPGPPAPDLRPQQGVGEVLAAEALRSLEPGARLVVIARDPSPFEVPASAAQLEGFFNALNHAGKRVAFTNLIKLDPLRRMAVPPGDFFDLMRRGGENDVIVSLLGPPLLEPQQLAKLGAKRPRVLALCASPAPAQANLAHLFEQRLLTAAVINRSDAPARSTASGARSAFDQMFKLVTSANLSELPAPARGGR
jgi:hypothetical protein